MTILPFHSIALTGRAQSCLLCDAGLVCWFSAVHPHIIDIHICQTVIPGQIDRPAAAGGEIDQKEKGEFLRERKRLVAAHLDVVAVVDRVRIGDLTAVSVERLKPGGRDSELAHANWIVQSVEGFLLDGLAGVALFPCVRANHVGIESVRLTWAFPAVSFNDVQLIARHFDTFDVIRHVIRHEPEGRPRSSSVGADKSAFKVAGSLGRYAAGIVLHGGDQTGTFSFLTRPDAHIRIDLTEGIVRLIKARKSKRTEVLPAARRFVIVVGGLGICAGNGERSIKVIGKNQRHTIRCRRWVFGHSFVPGNAAFIVKLEVAIVFDIAVFGADCHRNGALRLGFGGKDERTSDFRIECDGSNR